MAKNNQKQEELDQIQGLIETENESLDLHILDYFNPAANKMTQHIEDKSNYLTKYAKILQELCVEDITIGLLDGVVDEIRDIKFELRQILKNSLADDLDLHPRGHLTHYTKVINIGMVDLINRLQRIQKILNTAFMNQPQR